MKKNRKSLRMTLILIVTLVISVAFSAFAAQSNAVSKDGLTVQLFTDKDAYEIGETVKVNVQVNNQTGKEVLSVTTIDIPEGLELEGESVSIEKRLQINETWTTPNGIILSVVETPATDASTKIPTTETPTTETPTTETPTTETPTIETPTTETPTTETPTTEAPTTDSPATDTPATGDTMRIGLWTVLTVLAGGCIVALLGYFKNRKSWLSLMLCIAIVAGGMSVAALSVDAADVSGEIEVSCTVLVNGEEVPISAAVSYVIYNETSEETGDSATEAPETDAPEIGDDTIQEKTTRMEAILGLVNSALTYGRNLEGSYYPNLFLDGVNVETKAPMSWKLNGVDYYFSNLYGQQNLMKIFDGLTELTGDESYREIAYEQYQFHFDHLTDENGLLYAGAHTLLDVMTGKLYTTGVHETKGALIPWNLMYAADPEGTERFIEAYWNAHIYDFSNLDMSRHGEYNKAMGDLWDSEYTDPDPRVQLHKGACAFTVTANDLMEAAYFLAIKTGEDGPRIWADYMMDKILGIQSKQTGLVGSTYGTTYTDEYGFDRFIYNFAGVPELEGYDETQYITRVTVKSTAAVGPQSLAAIYNQTENQKIYDYIVGNMLGVAEYVYDAENHCFKTPIMYDGFDVGGITSLVDGYYLGAGKSIKENETVYSGVLQSAIDVYKISGEKKIWEMARAWAQQEGLGDIGTDLGENVNVNLDTTNASALSAMAVVTLYKYTENMEYYQLACKIGDNIIEKYYHDGLFYTEGKAYTTFDTNEAYAVFAIEMMAQGKLDKIVDLKFAKSSIDLVYDGYGRVGADTIYAQTTVPAESVTIDREAVALIVDTTQNYLYPDTEGHWAESQIRQLAALEVLECKADGKFYPDEEITCDEFILLAEKLCGITTLSVPTEIISKGDQLITREEMAAVLVCALKAVNPTETYYVADALYRFSDADSIAEWAREAADIAVNYRLMEETEVNVFDAKGTVTRADAAVALKNLSRYIANEDVKTLNVTVGPEGATNDVVIWTTSNPKVVEVDQYGNLFAVGVGEATVTATVGSISDTTKVTVGEKESWMLQKIYIDGVNYALFEPGKMAYTIELPLGTQTVPVITAVSYDDRAVTVNAPDSLPGTVEVYIDADHKYELYFDPCFVEYAIDEDFDNFEPGTCLQDVETYGYHLLVGTYYKKTVLIVEDPKGENTADHCVVIPYDEIDKNQAKVTFNFPEMKYSVGNTGDENVIIFDMDLMFENFTAEDAAHFNIRVTNAKGTNVLGVDFRSDLGGVFAFGASRAKLSEMITDKYFNLKIVVHKDDLTADYYLNNKLKASEHLPKETCEEISALGFNMAAGLNTDTEWYLDNLKIYEVTPTGFNIMMEEIVNAIPEVSIDGVTLDAFDLYTEEYTVKLPQGADIPEVKATCVDDTVEVEVVQAVQFPGDAIVRVNGKAYTIHLSDEYLMDEDYNSDSYTAGDKLISYGKGSTTKYNFGDYFAIITQAYKENATIVLNPVTGNTATSDKSILFSYDTVSEERAVAFRLLSNTSVKVGDGATNTNLLVFDFDIMTKVTGDGITPDGITIGVGNSAGNVIQKMGYNSGCWTVYSSSSGSTKTAVEYSATKFDNIRIVVDKKTRNADFYINGVRVKSSQSSWVESVDTINGFVISIPIGTNAGVELYLDNLKIYEVVAEKAKELGVTSDPLLTGITVDGVALDGFNADTPNYEVKLPVGAEIPEIMGVCSDGTTKGFTYEEGEDGAFGTAILTQSGKTYTVAFKEAPTITEIKMDGVALEGFAAGINEYTVRLAQGAKFPTVTATCSDPTAEVVIVQAAEALHKATVSLGEMTYTINFSYDYILNKNYNDNSYTAGNTLISHGTKVNSTRYTYDDYFTIITNSHINKATIVANTVTGSTNASDKSILFSYDPSSGSAVNFRLLSNTSVTVGEGATDTNLLVFDFDIMTKVTGDGITPDGITIGVGNSAGNVIQKMGYDNGYWTVYSSTDTTTTAQYSTTGFDNIRIVVDKQNRSADFYINGIRVVSSQSGLSSKVTSVNGFVISIPANTKAGVQLYLDNLKIYEVVAEKAKELGVTSDPVLTGITVAIGDEPVALDKAFDAEQTTYMVKVSAISDTPEVKATYSDGASKNFAYDEDTLTAKLTLGDKTYTVKFITITEITVDGVALEDFVAGTTTYTAALPAIGATPIVKAVYSDETEQAIAYVAAADGKSGTASMGGYTINFSYDYIVKEDYNSYDDGTLLNTTTGGKWTFIQSQYKNYAKVITRTDSDAASTTDKCFVIEHASNETKEGKLNLTFDNPITIGSEADENLLVVSMDIMVPKTLNELEAEKFSTDWFRILMRGENNNAVQQLTYISRANGELKLREKTGSTDCVIAKNEFVNLKIVLDKDTKTADYYIDGVCKMQNVLCLSAGAGETAIKDIQFYLTAKSDWNAYNYQFYFDNIEVYEITPAAANA